MKNWPGEAMEEGGQVASSKREVERRDDVELTLLKQEEGMTRQFKTA